MDSDPRLLLAALAATNATIVAILGGQVIAVWMRAQDLLETFFQSVLSGRSAAKRGDATRGVELNGSPENGQASNTGLPSVSSIGATAKAQSPAAGLDADLPMSTLLEPDVNEMYRLSLMGLGIMGGMAVAGVMLPLIAIATERTAPVVVGGVAWITLTGIWAVVVYVWRTVIGSWDLRPSEAMREAVRAGAGVDAAVRTSRSKDRLAAGAVAVGALVLLALLVFL